MGKSLSLNNKVVAVTGASGTMGRALIAELQRQGAKPIALTTSPQSKFTPEIRVVPWQSDQVAALQPELIDVDILIINHGINVHGARPPAAIAQSLEVNSLSVLALIISAGRVQPVKRPPVRHRAGPTLKMPSSRARAGPTPPAIQST